MKIIASRTGLLSACQIASAAVPTRDIKPVLRNVKLIAGEGCDLMATDLEVGVCVGAEGVRVEEPGVALASAARLTSILREATDDEFVITSGPDATVIRGRSSTYKLPGEATDAFPDVPAFDETAGCVAEVAAGVLREQIRRTIWATGMNARFGATSGVRWEVDGASLTLVSTDGSRLSMSSKPCQVVQNRGIEAENLTAAAVPVRAMSLIDRSIANLDAAEVVRLAIRANDILIMAGRTTVYSRQIDGRFPTYRARIPKDNRCRVTVRVGDLHGAVRQAAIMTDDESIRVAFRFANSVLTLTARGASAGESNVEIPIPTYEGKPLEILFNPKYVIDVLKVMDQEATVTIEMGGANSPAVLRGSDDDGYLYVLVPLHSGS